MCSFSVVSTLKKDMHKNTFQKKGTKFHFCVKKKENPITNISVSYTLITSEHVSFYKRVCFLFPFNRVHDWLLLKQLGENNKERKKEKGKKKK